MRKRRGRKYSPLFFDQRRAGPGVMTRAELIRLIGDVLRQLDALKATRPTKPGGDALTEVRNTLAKNQLRIAITQFDESGPAFVKAVADILAASSELRGADESADNGVALIKKLQ